MNAVDAALEGQRVGRRQIAIIALLTMALVLDGLDNQLLAFSAPVIGPEWGLTNAELGVALAAAPFGMAIGALLGGWTGDRFGRRPTVIAGVAVFSLLTILLPLAETVEQLTAIRVISGVAFGGTFPGALTLGAEILPARVRPRSTGILAIGVPAGSAMGAALSLVVLSRYGWQLGFVVCGVLSLLLVPLLWRLLPESPAFLMAQGRHEEAARSLTRTLGGVPVTADALNGLGLPAPERAARSPLTKLFIPLNRRTTIGLWISFAAVYVLQYAVNAWLPTVLRSAGIPLTSSISASLTFFALGIAGAVSCGLLVARFGSKKVLLPAGLFTAVLIVLLIPAVGFATAEPAAGSTLMLAGTGLIGLGSALMTAALWTLSAHAYPTAYRATGVGASMVVGRISAIGSTLAGGFLLSATSGNTAIFFGILAVAVLASAAAAVFIVQVHIPGRNLPTVTPHGELAN